jgi:uncharacterized alpha-E superfamily protein
MGRYIERAENVARFVDVSLHLALDMPGGRGEWGALVSTTGDDALYRERHGAPTRDAVLKFLAFDRSYGSSIVSCLSYARENARSVREIISSEMWEQINTAYLMAKDAKFENIVDEPHAFFDEIKKASHLFVGTTYLTMTHNEAWHFCRLGRLLERADKTSRILDVKYFLLLPEVNDVGTTYDELQWAALLKSASALEMYRKKHGLISPPSVVDFLLLERRFPRSVRYSLNKADRSLHAITGSPIGSSDSKAERALGRLSSELEFADTREILTAGIHEYLDGVQTKLNTVGDAIHETFFAMGPVDEPPPSQVPTQTQSQSQK